MNYTKRAALLCCTCFLVLFALSFIPPQKVCGVELRRANPLSDLVSFSADNHLEQVELILDEAEYEVDLEDVAQQVVSIDEISEEVERNFEWGDTEEQQVVDVDTVAQKVKPSQQLIPGCEVVPIEDYDTTQNSPLRRLYRKLIAGDSLVRIAVLGDSFVEADIITADLREALQGQYGGCGAGFAPMHSPLTRYRSTIKTDAKGWTSYNVMQHKTTPEPYNSLFTVSGWVSAPGAGAYTTWHTTAARKGTESCERVRLHFLARKDASIEVSINGGEPRTFDVDGGATIRQIVLRNADIQSVTAKVVAGSEGFVGYGAIFEGTKGVVVDNYSVRSNNGQAMFWTSASLNAQIDNIIGGYDLVILQYGLNIMQSGVNKYSAYSAQVEKMISYVQHCYPKAAIVVLGVSDRSMKKNGLYQPMQEAVNLTEYQRMAAENCGVSFWNTYEAMQEQGGMTKFVANGWAGKDYTHINFKGGQRIAYAIVDALNQGVAEERAKAVQKVDFEPIVEGDARSEVENRFLEGGDIEPISTMQQIEI